MNNDDLQNLVAQGLSAMKAGSGVAAEATSDIRGDVTHPALKEALEQGEQSSKKWAETIDRASKKLGKNEQQRNEILEAHYEVSRQIRRQASDATARDLGIVASGQLALHYWIASFGTMATYTEQLNEEDTASDMKSFAEEAKKADQRLTIIADKILQE